MWNDARARRRSSKVDRWYKNLSLATINFPDEHVDGPSPRRDRETRVKSVMHQEAVGGTI